MHKKDLPSTQSAAEAEAEAALHNNGHINKTYLCVGIHTQQYLSGKPLQ